MNLDPGHPEPVLADLQFLDLHIRGHRLLIGRDAGHGQPLFQGAEVIGLVVRQIEMFGDRGDAVADEFLDRGVEIRRS